MGTVSSLRVLLCVPLRNLRTASFRLNTPLQSAELTQPIALASGNSQIRWKCRRINPRLMIEGRSLLVRPQISPNDADWEPKRRCRPVRLEISPIDADRIGQNLWGRFQKYLCFFGSRGAMVC
jgi:hypothetical protein